MGSQGTQFTPLTPPNPGDHTAEPVRVRLSRWRRSVPATVRAGWKGISLRVRVPVYAIAVGLVAYLLLIATYPWMFERFRPWVGWFGSPGSIWTVVIVSVTIALACMLAFTGRGRHRSSGAPIGVTVALTAISAVLGFSSYIWCHDPSHPAFVTPLLWTGSVVKGGIDDRHIGFDAHTCPGLPPIALDIARISALAAVFVGVVSIATALLQSRLDRIRIRFDSAITAVVGPDQDADSMVTAVARTLEDDSRLVVITTTEDEQRRSGLRRARHRVVAIDFDAPGDLESLPIWPHLRRLYLLGADPATNLQRLKTISSCVAGSKRRRLPLIARIDDPWQAEAWRAQHFGGSDERWAADAVGKYEVTAHRLLDRITDNAQITKIIVCGSTPLTLAICANMLRHRLERAFYSPPSAPPLPTVTIVGESAEEYRKDQEFHLQQRGLPSAQDWIHAVPQPATVSCLGSLLADTTNPRESSTAVIITEAAVDPMLGTRLAARFPRMPIFAWSPTGQETLDLTPIVGELHTYQLTMYLPPGHSQDVWERAAMLIHARYVAEVGHGSPATKPWNELEEFYRGSNRRQVRNALWMVEQIAGHTWDTFGRSSQSHRIPAAVEDPFEQLRQMGFDRDAALAMARAEHEDWRRYYRHAGWHYGPVRDDSRRVHDNLIPWADIENNPQALNRALASLAATLSALRELGYRSSPVWQRFRRTGTVTAEKRDAPWTWTSASGQTMRGEAGDWAVCGPDGEWWSVRDDIFRATYEHLDDHHWQRTGFVNGRPAKEGEVIETLEGRLTAHEGEWIVQGSKGEQWAVAPDTFARRYEGPVGL